MNMFEQVISIGKGRCSTSLDVSESFIKFNCILIICRLERHPIFLNNLSEKHIYQIWQVGPH